MRPFIAYPFSTRELQLSTVHLSSAAESGAVAASFADHRQHQVPRDWPSAIMRFLDPGPARPVPKPSSASRPAPRRHVA